MVKSSGERWIVLFISLLRVSCSFCKRTQLPPPNSQQSLVVIIAPPQSHNERVSFYIWDCSWWSEWVNNSTKLYSITIDISLFYNFAVSIMVLSLTKNLWDACELWVPRPIGPYQTPPEYNNEYLELEPIFHSYILAVSKLSSYAPHITGNNPPPRAF